MNSSTKIKITPEQLPLPVITRWHPKIRLHLLTSTEEQALREAIATLFAPCPPPSVIQAYHQYWWTCRAANAAHVSPRTFYRHAQRHRGSAQAATHPRFMDVALIDETTMDISLTEVASS